MTTREVQCKPGVSTRYFPAEPSVQCHEEVDTAAAGQRRRCGVRLRTAIAAGSATVAIVTAVSLWLLAVNVSEDALKDARTDQLKAVSRSTARLVRDYFETTSIVASRYVTAFKSSFHDNPTRGPEQFLSDFGVSVFADLHARPTLASLLIAQARHPDQVAGLCDVDGMLLATGYVALMTPETSNQPEGRCPALGPASCGNSTRWNSIAGARNLSSPLTVVSVRKDMPCTSWLGATSKLWVMQHLPGARADLDHGLQGLEWLGGTVVVGAYPKQALYKKVFFRLDGPAHAPNSAFGGLSMRVGQESIAAGVGSITTGQILEQGAASSDVKTTFFLVTADKELLATSDPSIVIERRGSPAEDGPGRLLGLVHADNASAVPEPILGIASGMTAEYCSLGSDAKHACDWSGAEGRVVTRNGWLVATAFIQDRVATGLELVLVMMVKNSDVLEPAEDLTVKLTILGSCVIVCACAIVLVLAQIASAPISQMATRIEKAGETLDLSSLRADTVMSDVQRMQEAMLSLVTASVSGAEQVAACLARYDVAGAQDRIERCSAGMPTEMMHALRTLLENLKTYREYLPDAILHDVDSGVDDCVAVAPGEGERDPSVCVCFTDIQSSTALWERCPQGMYEALNIHNTVMRENAARCHGYEVKTIGDAFMLAFPSAHAAADFALSTQSCLVHQAWPAELVQDPLCARAGAGCVPTWHGLRVRIGLNWGPVRVDRNPLTRRCDYFGPTVNCAARIEACIKFGGLIGVTKSFLEALGEKGLAAVGSPATHALSPRTLKGVSEPVPVTLMVPSELGDRLSLASQVDDACVEVPTARPRRATRVKRSSDASSARESVVMEKNRGHRMGLQYRNSCTALAVRIMNDGEDAIAQILTAVESACDATHGVLVSIQSSTCMLSWHSPSHISQAVHFMALFSLSTPPDDFRAGAASGPTLHGNVATARRRFNMLVGNVIDRAAALAEEACMGRDGVLATDSVAAHCHTLGLAQHAHVWLLPTGATVIVFAVTPCELKLEWAPEEEGEETSGLPRRLTDRVFTDAAAAVHNKDESAAGNAQRTIRGLIAEARTKGHREELEAMLGRVVGKGIRMRAMPAHMEPVDAFEECGS